jgi:hypothetical protein
MLSMEVFKTGTSTWVGGCYGGSPRLLVSVVAGRGSADVFLSEPLLVLFLGPSLQPFGMEL